jgi:hypothetical protein
MSISYRIHMYIRKQVILYIMHWHVENNQDLMIQINASNFMVCSALLEMRTHNRKKKGQ